jgi:hypothetical protein
MAAPENVRVMGLPKSLKEGAMATATVNGSCCWQSRWSFCQRLLPAMFPAPAAGEVSLLSLHVFLVKFVSFSC